MKNLIKFLTCVFCLLLTSDAFSQVKTSKYPSIQVIESDTVIIFDLEQGRKLAIINESKKHLEQLNDIQLKELNEKDSIIINQNAIIVHDDKIKKAYTDIIVENKKLEKLCQDEKSILMQEIKKQKRYKWTAIISGITVNITTLLITQLK
jgi:ASC-1-like (ASCH) protein